MCKQILIIFVALLSLLAVEPAIGSPTVHQLRVQPTVFVVPVFYTYLLALVLFGMLVILPAPNMIKKPKKGDVLSKREAKRFFLDGNDNVIFFSKGVFGDGVIVNTLYQQKALALIPRHILLQSFVIYVCMVFLKIQLYYPLGITAMGLFIYNQRIKERIRKIVKDLPAVKNDMRIVEKGLVIFMMFCFLSTATTAIQVSFKVLEFSRFGISYMLVAVCVGSASMAAATYFVMRMYISSKLGIPYNKVLYG